MNLGAALLTGLFAGGISCAAVQGGLLTGLVTRQQGLTPTKMKARPKVTLGAAVAAGPARRPASSGKASAKKAQAVRRKAAQRAQQQWRARTVEPPKPLHVRALAGLRTLRTQAGDDLLPVGAFLGGKLVSHAPLGALLGAVGAAFQLSVTVRVWTQLTAGALIIAFGLAQLGVGPFKRFAVEPPAAWSRFVRGRARSQASFAPAVLGFVTILVPCGITLSVEALALTSGSAVSGAAVMAVFVLGMGLYTFNGGLTLASSPLAGRNLPQTLGFSAGPAVADPSVVHVGGDGRQEVIVTARPGSYRPGNVAVKAGIPTTLVLRSVANDGCTRAVVIPSLRKQWILPIDGETPIDLGVLPPGKLRYTCAMGMYTGQLSITQ